MKLMTKQLQKTIPKPFENENSSIKDRVIYAHYFAPLVNFDWFVYEYDAEEGIFFGFANLNNPDCAELGYFTLQEFEEINKEHGFQLIERDMYFKQGSTAEVAEMYPILSKLL